MSSLIITIIPQQTNCMCAKLLALAKNEMINASAVCKFEWRITIRCVGNGQKWNGLAKEMTNRTNDEHSNSRNYYYKFGKFIYGGELLNAILAELWQQLSARAMAQWIRRHLLESVTILATICSCKSFPFCIWSKLTTPDTPCGLYKTEWFSAWLKMYALVRFPATTAVHKIQISIKKLFFFSILSGRVLVDA